MAIPCGIATSGLWKPSDLTADKFTAIDYDAGMAIRVEFYGIARQRAGISELSLAMPAEQVPLSELLQQIAAAAPDLGSELLAGGKLHKSITANLDGTRFISDPATAICDGQSLLILSADAGG